MTHLATLDALFSRLSAAGLSLALGKCQFGVDQVDYLGYTITRDGFKPLERKVKALQNFPPPTKQKEVLAFLGALNYYRSSLPKLSAEESVDKNAPPSRSPATVLDPLYKLATCNLEKKKDQLKKIWDSSEKVRNSFQDAKTLLMKAVTHQILEISVLKRAFSFVNQISVSKRLFFVSKRIFGL